MQLFGRWLRTVRLVGETGMPWVPAVFWYGVLTWLSHQSRLPGPTGEWREFLWFKTGHLLAYGILTFFVWYGWWRSSRLQSSVKKLRECKLAVFTFFTLVVLASIDEWHQAFIPGRQASLRDVFIDLFAVVTVLLIRSRYNQHGWHAAATKFGRLVTHIFAGGSSDG